MRHDMYRVITTPPRWGSSMRNRKSRLRLKEHHLIHRYDEELEDFDSGPSRLAMSRNANKSGYYERKEFSDLLGPLERFLLSRAGRHWDEVHSEISRELDNRSLMRGRHFWIHVYQLVYHPCFLREDGKIFVTRYGMHEISSGFYVHPETGILCHKQYKRHYR